ncbi:hypothetical protein A9304_02615 [Mycoplasmopsis bovis]|nr:restriction endonuclease subunit S [Mycoplasmopsis bovis]TQF47778.1 hypothetical protein A9304_02615 [Mycoplasmopsis bovis]
MKKVKLKDVLTEIIDFSSKAKYSGRSNITSERYIPTLSALSVHNNFIDYSKCYYVTLNEYKEMTSNRIPKIGDILLTKEAPVGRVAMLDKDNIAIGRRLWLLTGKENILDNNYLLYFLQWNKTQKLLKSISGGSAVKSVNINSFKNIEVNIHSYEEQIKIGHILSLIDKKINLNNKINDNLEKQIMKIYDEWFIKFNFPSNQNFHNKTKNKISTTSSFPSTWEIQQLNNNVLCSIIPSGIEKFEGEKIYYPTKSLQNKSIKDGERITYKNRKTRADMHPIKNSVWFAKMKDTKKHLFISENMDFIINDSILSTGFCGLLCNKNSFEYISSIVMNSNFEEKKNFLSHGATQQAINIDDLSNIEITIPDKETLNKYHSLTKPLFLKITENIIENRKLSSLKEILLPLLMNGQVTIED